MNRAHRYIATLFLTAAIATPAMVMAAPAPQISIQFRAYDRQHKDYHNWDGNEDQAYRGYLQEQHRNYRVYNKQPRRTQDQYWNWRHSHEDYRN